MSQEKYREDSRRWLLQAKADLRAARISLDGGSFEWACFQSQQAGEKALWYFHTEDPRGHSLVRLIRDFPLEEIRQRLLECMNLAKALDKLYVLTRYPNGLPDLTPADVYTDEEARSAIAAAERLIERVDAMTG